MSRSEKRYHQVPQSSRIVVVRRSSLAPSTPCFVDFVREKQLPTVFALLTRHLHQLRSELNFEFGSDFCFVFQLYSGCRTEWSDNR